MRYDIDESMRLIQFRSREIIYRKKRRNVYYFATLAAAVFIAFVVTIYSFTGFGQVHGGNSAYGAYMLSDEAGGYIVIGVICFVLAVVLTLICVKYADKTKKKGLRKDGDSDNLDNPQA